jgi:hypothetical protein
MNALLSQFGDVTYNIEKNLQDLDGLHIAFILDIVRIVLKAFIFLIFSIIFNYYFN